jgi:hypothetical protein
MPLGMELRVNSYTTQGQAAPSIAVSSSGMFVVVWNGPDGSAAVDGGGIFGQLYDESGLPVGVEFRVNSYSEHSQGSPDVAIDPYGDFVVVWASALQDGDGSGVFGQRFEWPGVAVGGEFRVNTQTAGQQTFPAIGLDEYGTFLVVWQSGDGSSDGIFGQRFGPSGHPDGAEFRVNSYTTNEQWFPAVGMGAAGRFVVSWTSSGQDGSYSGVFGQLHDITGLPQGDEFRVNTTTYGFQTFPAAAMDLAENFVVVWSGPDGSELGIAGQRFGDLLFADGFEG